MRKNFINPLVAFALALFLSVPILADTIRLKDGSVIRGEVIGFKDQQFTVLIGGGARGRRSRVTLYMEDVESIEFDSATSAAVSAITNEDAGQPSPMIQSSRPSQPQPEMQQPDRTNTPQPSQPNTSRPAPAITIPVRVRADNTANGWTSTGFTVRRGQRLRISATGRVNLGSGRFSTPGGIATMPDRDKLMRNEPTGALIAVIGDDNDDFIFIGSRREFIAQRDGILFLGVNEGNLADNTGVFDVIIEAETAR